MNAWIECPQCRGVLKLSSSHLEGPCVFCRIPLRVTMEVQALAPAPVQAYVNAPIPVQASGNSAAPIQAFATIPTRPEPRHKLGRGPLPKFRRLESRPG